MNCVVHGGKVTDRLSELTPLTDGMRVLDTK
jgi:hypothetical protein